jgi:hypothetical protein
MPIGFWFWLFMVIWLLWGLWRNWPSPEFRWFAGGHLLMFVLFAMLGWHDFGAPWASLVR